MCMETSEKDWEKTNDLFFANLDLQLKQLTRNLEYSVSKSDDSVNTIRHGLILLKMRQQRESIREH